MRSLLLFFTCLSIAVTVNAGIVPVYKKTFVVQSKDIPAALQKNRILTAMLLVNTSVGNDDTLRKSLIRQDTIADLKQFLRLFKATGWRLVFGEKERVDSVLQTDINYRITDKLYAKNNDALEIIAYDGNGNVADHFLFDYKRKFSNRQVALPLFLRMYEIYNSTDRIEFAFKKAFVLSIGIDDYGYAKFESCKADAVAFDSFFLRQFSFNKGSALSYESWVLLDKDATKDSILSVLRTIASKASYNDYFIFCFSGRSDYMGKKGESQVTAFHPYDVVSGKDYHLKLRDSSLHISPEEKLISLKTLQEHIQQIPANNQLLITEAGPSKKFKTEFIRTLMSNSPTVASILNKNRIIMVPNDIGYDSYDCNGIKYKRGQLSFLVTEIGQETDFFSVFDVNGGLENIEQQLRLKTAKCQGYFRNYFSIFSERKFLEEYNEIFGEEKTRGITIKKNDTKPVFISGKKYAFIVGTDNYQGSGWGKLNNPYLDAKAIASVLQDSYGFEVTLLKDPPMDSVYKELTRYYQALQPDDQLIIYFAGHGDFDEAMLDDGFIVCTDSRSTEQDVMRNSYIQHSKLKKIINKIPAKQIMVLLDICHGGSFDENILGGRQRDNTSALSNMNVVQFLADKQKYITRRALSSVGKESAFDGKAGQHSPFAKLLLQVLAAKGEGTNGIITASNIFEVLQTASYNETASLKISPHMSRFGADDPLGEFILVPKENK